MTILKATAPSSIYGSNPSITSGSTNIGTASASTGYLAAGGSQSYSLTPANGDFTLDGWVTLGISAASAIGPSYEVQPESIAVSFSQNENGAKVKATLNPDTNLSTIELLRLNVLLSAGQRVQHPLSYIRAHSLERHFLFEAE